MSETDKAVAKVIESAGKIAPELWADMVAAERLQAFVAIVVLFAFSIGMALVAKRTLDVGRRVRADKSYNDGEGWFLISAMCALSSALLLFSSTCWFDDAIYPQASVVRSVVNQCDK